MKVSELTKKLALEVLNDGGDKEIKGCYIGDLLSWVMGRASEGDAWITIMSNINIVAVAQLFDAACIILCEGVTPDEGVISRASSEGITVLRTEKSAYETAVALCGVI